MSAVPSVWLHGTGMAGLRWGPEPEGLWLDLPGNGAMPRVTPSVEAFATALAPGLPERFAVAGHSLGGMVAMQLAARFPDRCRALVLVETPLRMPWWMMPGLAGLAVPLVSRVPGPRGLAKLVSRRVKDPALRPEVYAAFAATPQGGLHDCMLAAMRFNGLPLMRKLTMPVLCLLGTTSPVTGRTEAEAFSAHPTAQLAELEASHLLPFDAAQSVASLIARFLEDQT